MDEFYLVPKQMPNWVPESHEKRLTTFIVKREKIFILVTYKLTNLMEKQITRETVTGVGGGRRERVTFDTV